jgi:hypothetical protein
LVVKDLAAELPENWMQAGADDDWEATLGSLQKNLGTISMHFVEDAGMMRVVWEGCLGCLFVRWKKMV